MRRARAAAHRRPGGWTAARQLLVRAVNAAQNDPVVLAAYYRSFVMQGVLPPDDAQNALYTAMELAPSDGELRYQLARDFEQRHMIREAIAIIRPEAYQARASRRRIRGRAARAARSARSATGRPGRCATKPRSKC